MRPLGRAAGAPFVFHLPRAASRRFSTAQANPFDKHVAMPDGRAVDNGKLTFQHGMRKLATEHPAWSHPVHARLEKLRAENKLPVDTVTFYRRLIDGDLTLLTGEWAGYGAALKSLAVTDPCHVEGPMPDIESPAQAANAINDKARRADWQVQVMDEIFRRLELIE